MRLGKELTGKPIISVTDGRFLGNVKDLYLDEELNWVTGIYLGSEGLLKRSHNLIDRENIVVFGIDAILVRKADIVTTEKEHEAAEKWLRLDKLRGREVDTPGGTKVGTIGDIIIGSEGEITSFALGKVFVEGPIAEKGQLPRQGLIDTGSLDGGMTIDLPRVEAIYQGVSIPTQNDEQT
jgi:uncharacterized protein YrrD